MRFADIKISKKTFLGYFSIALLLVVVAVTDFVSLHFINNNYREVVEKRVPAILKLEDFSHPFHHSIILIHEYIANPSERSREPLEQGPQELEILIGEYRKLSLGEEREDFFEKIGEQRENLKNLTREIISLQETGLLEGEVLAQKMEELHKLHQSPQEIIEAAIAKEQEDLKISEAKTRDTIASTVKFNLGLIIFVLFILFWHQLLMTKDIVRPLEKISELSRKISQGNLEKRLEVKSRDEIGILSESLNKMLDSLQRIGLVEKERAVLGAKVGELEKRAKEFSTLTELAERLGYPPNTRIATQITAYTLSKIIKFSCCTHLILEEGRMSLHYFVSEPITINFIKEAKKRIIALALRMFSGEIQKMEVLEDFLGTLVTKEEIEKKVNSFIAVPIVLGRTPLGILCLASSQLDIYTDETKMFLEAVTAEEAIAFSRLQAVAEAERGRIEALAQSMDLGVVVVDEESQVTIVNPAAKKMLGKKEEEKVNLSDLKLFFGAHDLEKILKDCLEQRKSQEIPELPQDTRIILHAFVSPLETRGIKKEASGAAIILEDVTKERTIDRLRKEFVAMVSHQLKSPLTVIRGNLEMILGGDFGKIKKEQGKPLSDAFQSSEKMIDLVEDILDLSKIETGELGFKPEIIQLEDLTETIIKEFLSRVKEEECRIKFSKPPKPLPKVMADPLRARQVIQNLLDNALRYSPRECQIEIKIEQSENNLIFSIKDNGLGIPKIEQARIFARFYRASNVSEIAPKGTGLGLYISKSIIEQSGGKIWFESEENRGSTFYFSLPIANQAK